jgi:tetratricopeptide (TPR) repeat protein
MAPHVRQVVWLAALACLLACTTRANASDFWDEVRNPGLFGHRSHVRGGRQAIATNRGDLALREADTAIALCQACADGHVLRGRALTASGRLEDAVASFERALGLREDALDDASDALTAAMSALRAGHLQLSATILTRVLALSRDPIARSRALAMLADALQAQGPAELRRALAAYGEAMRDDEARKHALLGLALALHRKGEPAQALSLARQAGELETRAASNWLPEPEREARLALWLGAIGDHSAAVQAWQLAADSNGPWREHARAALLVARKDAGLP